MKNDRMTKNANLTKSINKILKKPKEIQLSLCLPIWPTLLVQLSNCIFATKSRSFTHESHLFIFRRKQQGKTKGDNVIFNDIVVKIR